MNTSKGRRTFLKASAAGLTILNARSVFGASDTVSLGVIGSGSRGIHVGTSFMQHTKARVTAVADLFEDRLADGANRFNGHLTKAGQTAMKPSRLFRGSEAYKRILDLKDIDAVLIATPHFVHPGQLSDAVDAGKHVYLEKPVAVDVRGCRRVMAAGERAAGRVSVAVGFQIRSATPFVEMVRRIHTGDIGGIVMGRTWYLAGGPARESRPAPPEELRVRLWGLFRALSGDNILLQGIHALDICNWVFGSHPVSAMGVCGRDARDDIGDNNSHFHVTFTYPGGIPVTFQSQQFDPGYGDVCEQFFGTAGISESHYTGGVFIKGANEWDSGVPRAGAVISAEDWNAGRFKSALDDADPNKEKEFIDSITGGAYLSEAASGAESTLTALLGTLASYSGGEMTWDEMIASDLSWDPLVDLKVFDE